MYQSNVKKFTEEDFNFVTKSFEDNVTNFKLDSNSIEFDMTAEYTPNWVCIWNKVKDIGKPCKILQKNDKLALVLFKGENEIPKEDIVSHLFRIEDLSLYSRG